MAVLEAFLVSLAANATYGLTNYTVSKVMDAVRKEKPELEAKAEQAVASGNVGELPDLAAGALEVAAASGTVEIRSAAIEAVRSAVFDHQHGHITIGGSRVYAPTLQTGGSHGATGQTSITENTSLKSAGTEIKIGKGASIRITGNANIRQN
ncbi:hypothetical protein SAMN06265173_106128 [Thalassovita litoralis]|uniref:Uncharacterized protein n=1 Tax=Thalassovita litoralis TaxID=1010611 RepID=A0A521CG29_9RHOB|nr:hypothetical protein [Thalassovita litoralis]SMO58325.1 hypothetical protein SAMN06265173_106128 [Thalassovita litoralis]